MVNFVLLSQAADHQAFPLRQMLVEAGISVLDHLLGSTPTVQFDSILVAIIEVGTRADAAVSQTRRWRAELGDEWVPILWRLPETSTELAARGLEAGADVVLSHPLDKNHLLAQVQAACRMRAAGLRVQARADEARLLGEQLQKTVAQIDRDLDTVQRLQHAFIPQLLPEIGSARFAVYQSGRNQTSHDFYSVIARDDNRVGFSVGTVIGSELIGSLTGVFIAQSVGFLERGRSGTSLIQPDEILSLINRKLFALRWEERPLVAMAAGVLDARSGELMLARAGFPGVLSISASGEFQTMAIPGPLLGTSTVTYQTEHATLKPGHKLLLGTDGLRPEDDLSVGANSTLLDAAQRQRSRTGPAFVDAVAHDLLGHLPASADFTLLCVEMS